MAGLKEATVTRFFRTPVTLTDQQIADWLKTRGITVTITGKGGFPAKDTFHLDEPPFLWCGSRLDGYENKILAFFSEEEDDPIFLAVLAFSEEITGDAKTAILSELEKIKKARHERENALRVANTRKARAIEATQGVAT